MGATLEQLRGPVGVSVGDICNILQRTYEARGWSRALYINDSALLRRLGVHPEDASLSDLEWLVNQAGKKSTKAHYVARLKSLYRTMRELGLVTSRVDEGLRRIPKPRAVPRPLTDDEAAMLMARAGYPYRDWFILGCMAGLRAMEVWGMEGEYFMDLGDGRYELRILGKGGTDITVPVHPKVAEVFRRNPTQGRLWPLSSPNKVSRYACREMRRLGIPEARAKFHACRHYFATRVLEASGWDLLSTSKLMRHASVATTQGYTALRRDRLEDILKAVS